MAIKNTVRRGRSTYDAAPRGVVEKRVFRCDVVPDKEEEEEKPTKC